MIVSIQYVQMPDSEAMTVRVNQKLEKLGSKHDSIIKAEVFFKQENDSIGKGKVCGIELNVKGARLFAESRSENFEKSLAETINDLTRQLRKRKTALQGNRGVTDINL